MVVFFAPQVRDVATGQIVAGLVGQSVTIVYPGTSDPVEITEYPSDIAVPGSVLTVGNTFSLPSFNTPEGVYAVEALASNGTRVRLTSDEGLQLAAEGSRLAAVAAQDAAEQALAAVQEVAAPTWDSLAGKPAAFPPVVGTGPNDAFPGNGNMDSRYYTKAQADARFAPFGSGGGGDATIEGIPSLIRVQSGGVYPPRGTSRTDLQIIWMGSVPPESATPSSGADFENEPIAMSRGTGQGPDRFEAIA